MVPFIMPMENFAPMTDGKMKFHVKTVHGDRPFEPQGLQTRAARFALGRYDRYDIPPVCFAADTEQDQQSWTEALRTRAQACSLDIQGLNLEGCANLAAGIREVSKRDENVLAQTLELLDELLKKKSQGQKLKKGQDQLGNSQEGVDEVEQASIMAHQEALRKATHLRQRKISTELKEFHN
ncbi:hypothetical protein HPB47_003924 [Ixodes persulcatus]|uniref:Uncharacterized protein n=1 Tax=Ixodes persulcatus TaxID=34615 RepID=A0AC60PH35_IXOPE|nr:hypothetical protein HPB47_003924 [Ixodes persulcatus]